MVRPCFLVVDREHSGNISTRKLVIETAKFNVITAYSGEEAVATLRKFPALDGVVMDVISSDVPSEDIIRLFKSINPEIPVVAVKPPRFDVRCENADHVLESFDPRSLLALLQRLCPAATAEIERGNELLDEEGRD